MDFVAGPPRIPPETNENSAVTPWPVHIVAEKLKKYVEDLPSIWVEGQIIELHRRATATYITLRDLNQEVSFSVQAWSNVIDKAPAPINRGSRVVVLVKPNYWLKTGRLSMQAHAIRTVGLGDLLVRIEALRQKLASEGLFNPELKKPLPLLPRCIGVITGRNSDAGKDIRRNATLRWPGVRFEYREVATQGTNAVQEITAALHELDVLDQVDVIVIARGGGSLEDLLPFNDEHLVRAVFAANTPVVSAIGHEADNPILDNVADMRASTPTDAAKRIVPDVAEEKDRLKAVRQRLTRTLEHRIESETYRLRLLASHQVFTQPTLLIQSRHAIVQEQRRTLRNVLLTFMSQEKNRIHGFNNQIRSLSPQNTLDRGYAIVQNHRRKIVRSSEEVKAREKLTVKVASGDFNVQVQ